MKIIQKGNLNVLIPEEGYLLRDKNEVLEESQEPYLTDSIYLAKTIDTVEQCQELWEEVKIEKIENE